ncbi:UDP-3-O-(3-hydroxymyristoyl)glucosamine N-acyltransferase [Hydrogenivirga sp. 128-5-R1-1]|uniref:UDP-3-O-(3-hydroxymyristoyl)glucosamine N-acyltransferase n=1 Tax=Hydrogenivirga sp. 128-5-R1-1 TaxID=392423 RepID=UPI00015F105E|nr:UDP-3-O-(3-hydroxymyristoyl)glucosamine N-acyltransferase [Hydrogenivirga sp. 128-5-R1-1]EDP74279.1 UDP-3-O-[3-hydroxymyristoyl] glucosamine N acyltransferase [Hydrogenivirga sp. 128-5-R1-1]
MKLSKIAEIFNGQLYNFKEDKEITGVSSLFNATENDISFLSDKKLSDLLKKTKAAAVFVKEPFEDVDVVQIVVNNPQVAFYKLIDILYPDEKFKYRKAKTAKIGKKVEIGENVYIGDYVVIEDNVKIGNNTVIYPFTFIGKNTEIGNDCVIYPRVSIYKDTKIGSRVIIHSGTVIASDGFGYYQENGKHRKIKHIGKVIIEDDVEIGANVTIDRAMLDETVIKQGTKIDNLVMIGHNVQIGENTILVSQVGIAGSSKVGNNCILAGQVGVADHITITDNVIITAKSGVGKNIDKAGVYGSGISAVEWSKWKKVLFYLYKLPEILRGRK